METRTINSIDDYYSLIEEEPNLGIFLRQSGASSKLTTIDTAINVGDTISWNPDYPGIVEVAPTSNLSNL